MSLDGVVVPTTYTAATKTFKHTPAAALAAGTHTVSFSAIDSSGGSVSKTWKFKVSPPMSNAADCTACHTGYPASHPTADCSKCHDHAYAVPAVPTAGPSRRRPAARATAASSRTTPATTWTTARTGSGASGAPVPFACADCHSATYPAVAQHTDAETTAAHVSSTTGCGPCHSIVLVTEHAQVPQPPPSSTSARCATRPRRASRSRTRSRRATPPAAPATPSHRATRRCTPPPSIAACAGNGCHTGTSLTSIHINSNTALTCDSCHESTDPDVVAAISTGDKSCAACHDALGAARR